MKKQQPEIKLIKLENRPGITYCLGSKDFTHNFGPLKIKMANKVPREKSNCVVCRSNKSRFLKQKHSKYNSTFYKLML